MKAILKSLAVVAASWIGTTQLAHAELVIPEPGSLPLVGLAIAAAIYVVRRGKK